MTMDYFETLARRRACREFTGETVSDAEIDRLLYAASWAPIASNRPYRHCIVVDDPAVIRAIRQISPSLQANAPLLIVIFSDLQTACTIVGKVADRCTAVDAGAAGQNVLLATTALGLGSQFTMISAMSGIRTILGLPQHCRVDLIIPVGHAVQAQPPVSAVAPKRGQRVFRNQYGVDR